MSGGGWNPTPSPVTIPVGAIALRPREAAAALGISLRMVHKLIKAGVLRTRTLGRARVISVADLHRLMGDAPEKGDIKGV